MQSHTLSPRSSQSQGTSNLFAAASSSFPMNFETSPALTQLSKLSSHGREILRQAFSLSQTFSAPSQVSVSLPAQSSPLLSSPETLHNWQFVTPKSGGTSENNKESLKAKSKNLFAVLKGMGTDSESESESESDSEYTKVRSGKKKVTSPKVFKIVTKNTIDTFDSSNWTENNKKKKKTKVFKPKVDKKKEKEESERESELEDISEIAYCEEDISNSRVWGSNKKSNQYKVKLQRQYQIAKRK